MTTNFIRGSVTRKEKENFRSLIFISHLSPIIIIRKGPSVVCYPCILQPSIRKGTKKYPFQSTQLHNLLLANVVSQSSEKLRNRQSPKSKCILLSCSPAGGGGGACGGGGGGGQRGRGGKGQLPPLLQLSFLAQK